MDDKGEYVKPLIEKAKNSIIFYTSRGYDESEAEKILKMAEEENKTKIATTTLSKMNKEQKEDLASLLAKQVVHFDFDKYNIRPDQMPIVEELANILKEHPGNWTIRIEGNCDEWGTDEYNYALGLKRAKTVKEALVSLGVDANKLTIISYGESNPVCTAHARWCWAKNRRDNFTLLP